MSQYISFRYLSLPFTTSESPVRGYSYIIGILTGLLILSTVHSQAQIIRVGPKAGVLASRIVHDEAAYNEEFSRLPGLGMEAGIALNTKVSERFSLQSELLVNQLRKNVESKLVPGDFLKEQANFISLPLLLRYSQKIGYTEVYANAGPRISYWVNGYGKIRTGEVLENGMEEMAYTLTFDGESEANEVFFIPDPNRFHLGLDVGGGALLPMGPNFLMLDLRYHWGHTNMARSGQGYIPIAFFNDDLRHSFQSLVFSVAFLFEFDFYTLSTKGKSTKESSEK